MTRDEFTAALEQELRLRAMPFSRAELLTWVADVWPVAQDDPDPDRWADAFLARPAPGKEE